MEIYNGRPQVISKIEIDPVYGINCLYMPIKMNDNPLIYLPDSFQFLRRLIFNSLISYEFKDNYVYLSYECSWVNAGVPQKRPGIHADGFMTEDINYIWYDKDPTIFYDQEFHIIKDHRISMEQFEKQADESKTFTHPVNTLLRLTERVPHKVAVPTESGIRQFFKLSISKDKYNLKGNTKNPLIDYNWEMHERSLVRNHPIYKEADHFPTEKPKNRPFSYWEKQEINGSRDGDN